MKRSELDEGEVVPITAPDGTPICLVRLGDDVCALLDNCSHQNFPLSSGVLLEDGTLECAWHGARFDPRTGEAVGLPAIEPIPTYDVVIDGEIIMIGPRRT